jgi:hypothetical protein
LKEAVVKIADVEKQNDDLKELLGKAEVEFKQSLAQLENDLAEKARQTKESKKEIKANKTEIEKLKKEVQNITMERDHNILSFEIQVQNQQKLIENMKSKKFAVAAMPVVTVPVGEFLNFVFVVFCFSLFSFGYMQTKYYCYFKRWLHLFMGLCLLILQNGQNLLFATHSFTNSSIFGFKT